MNITVLVDSSSRNRISKINILIREVKRAPENSLQEMQASQFLNTSPVCSICRSQKFIIPVSGTVLLVALLHAHWMLS